MPLGERLLKLSGYSFVSFFFLSCLLYSQRTVDALTILLSRPHRQ